MSSPVPVALVAPEGAEADFIMKNIGPEYHGTSSPASMGRHLLPTIFPQRPPLPDCFPTDRAGILHERSHKIVSCGSSGRAGTKETIFVIEALYRDYTLGPERPRAVILSHNFPSGDLSEYDQAFNYANIPTVKTEPWPTMEAIVDMLKDALAEKLGN
jgi:hypothetical protein